MGGDVEHEVDFSSGQQGNEGASVGPSHPGFTIDPKAIVALIIALLVYLVIQSLFKRAFPGKQGSSVLLIGPCGAGKTALYFQLKEGSGLNGTVTSMDENEGVFEIKAQGFGRPVHLVDLPGHPRLKDKVDVYIRGAAGVIFVIDATDFMPRAKDIGEQLYHLLCHPMFYNRRLPLLLTCNKADLGAKAHTEKFIVKLLEKEIESLRATQSTLAGENEGAAIGKPDVPFAFDHLKSKVGVAKVSALTGDIDPVLQFIKDSVKL